jgi:hypothetical protein
MSKDWRNQLREIVDTLCIEQIPTEMPLGKWDRQEIAVQILKGKSGCPRLFRSE